MTPNEIIRWLTTLHPDSTVCIDDGGLALREVRNDQPTDAYLEIGGVPEPE